MSPGSCAHETDAKVPRQLDQSRQARYQDKIGVTQVTRALRRHPPHRQADNPEGTSLDMSR